MKDGGASIVIFEQWMQTARRRRCCARSTSTTARTASRRGSCATGCSSGATRRSRQFGPFPLPEPVEPKPIPEVKEERAELRAQLLDAGEELAAQLLDYHDRERKPVWWAYFDRIEMTAEELFEDPESISGLTAVGEPTRVDRSWAYTLSFPPQEHKIREGQQTVDRATLKSPGAITDVEREARRLTLKRGRSFDDVDLPEAILPKSAFNTPEQEEALMRLGRSLLAGDRRYPALESILRREPFDRPVQTSDLDEMKELVLEPGRSPPRDPGAARLGEDVDVRDG